MTVNQQRAINPSISAWVAANAGSGKTKVLTDRILMLLLQGTPPSHILALTFTRVAAAEMLERLNKELSKWITMDETDLIKALHQMGITQPSTTVLTRARHLFAHVLEAKGGIKIQTIHGFCQMLLSRFAVEAGVSPQFTVMDEEENNTLLQQSLQQTFSSPTGLPLLYPEVLQYTSATIFQDALKKIIAYQSRLDALATNIPNDDDLIKHIFDIFETSPDDTEESLDQHFIDSLPYDDLLHIAHALQNQEDGPSKREKPNMDLIFAISEMRKNNAPTHDIIQKIHALLLTQKKEKKTHAYLASKDFKERFPHLFDILTSLQESLIDHIEHIKRTITAKTCASLNIVARQTYAHYRYLKQQTSRLSYDDLILITKKLLTSHNAATAWVLYKLDGGIDHILIDEAQDTNFEQWDIIKALTEEFFSGQSRFDENNKDPRTLFVVGDAKQSIYSFQRSDPDAFIQLRHYFEKFITDGQKEFSYIPLETSFRSAPAILRAVDIVFNHPVVQSKFPEKDLQHIPYQTPDKIKIGRVALLPLVQQNKDAPPTEEDDDEEQEAYVKLAKNISRMIASWVDKRPLRGENRLIKASDIMILMRQRHDTFVSTLNRTLKSLGIPTAGPDRLAITQDIAIQDLISAAEFTLSPYDDLTLACFLKSPFIGMTEETLYHLATNKDKNSLWDMLRQQQDPIIQDITHYITTIIDKTSWKPYDFFTFLLHERCPHPHASHAPLTGYQSLIKRLGHDIKDPIEAFLSYAVSFGQEHGHSLQHFIYHIQLSKPQIKREMDVTHSNQVRTLTVHSSKGLQAPIIIIADAHRPPLSHNKISEVIAWHKTDKPTDSFIPLWCPSGKLQPLSYKDYIKAAHLKDEEEHKRLLYVAMTRPQHELYVCGIDNKKLKEECWYNLIKHALQDHATSKPSTFIRPIRDSQTAENTQENILYDLIIEDPLTQDEDVTNTSPLQHNQATDQNPLTKDIPSHQHPYEMPSFFAALPVSPIQTITPSHPQANDQTKAPDPQDFNRGILVHRLLEFLPAIPTHKRLKTAQKYILNATQNTPQKNLWTQQNIDDLCHKMLSILEHEPFNGIFSPHSRSEVSLSGTIILHKKSVPINARVDRLIITDDKVIIVDFKSRTHIPSSPQRMPKNYLYQMTCYHTLMQSIMPNKHIQTAILWTEEPSLMLIPDTLIQETKTFLENHNPSEQGIQNT